ncbi:hypothetical protein M758_11G049400 [Ceratodon purpureus]|uniref:AAA+ ATPase domain-containing protein n=1 Tax=Ceratodon purpureus TaxID=3225 RepID=A0A8T0GBG9_CERPU|nr:hypothetical protein KC19_11G051000 [Ceratodon purpureus]KAG0556400.1 hypothetical protein KC19_11G051000 [Ceratodon purpureus]KAG0600634.1 hypothetical protein M758_11G049400 [Ceratodon purpureus]
MAFEMFTSRGKMGLAGGQRPSAMALQDSSNYLLSWVGYILLARTLIPPEIQWVLKKIWALIMRPYTCFFCIFHVYERNVESGRVNDLFKLVELYLDISGLCKEADQVVLATKHKKEKNILYKLTGRQKVEDNYKGVKVWWSLSKVSNDDDSPQTREPIGRRGKETKEGKGRDKAAEFVLKMHKKDKQFVMTEYLDHVIAEANEFKRQQKELKLFANQHTRWSKSYTFKHPSTFETLAMDPELKAAVKADLDNFRKSEEYFRRVGRAWKRGYLLYGPPGTGKSSMIAAMANYLKYDVYDLELTQVYSNDGLKKLFRDTCSRSIVVIEDIDCSLNLAGKRKNTPPPPQDIRELRRGRRSLISQENVTLSGLLNSVDGIWSCTTEERIIIFTTNHVEKLDPALIRPGRMDMRIHMSYCSFHSFKELVRSYLSIDWHPDFDEIRRLMEEEHALITPAQVTERLFEGVHGDPTACMRAVIDALRGSLNPNPNFCADDSGN